MLLLNCIPVSVQGLEGEVSAPSGSSFPAQTDSRIFYVLGGGIQSEFNRDTYTASGGQTLYTPYRCGYRFVGWYTDAGFHKRVETLPEQESGVLFLYAKWTPKINNAENVENYTYQWKTTDVERGRALLKDLDFGFYEQLDIPGMPGTKEEDVKQNHIFSASQCPQGLCLTDAFVLITSYSTEDDCMGELMVFDRESGDYLVTLGMDENSHLGGIAFDGTNVWVCNSYEKCIERISYDFIELMAYENAGEVIDARTVVDEFSVENTPSCITYYGGRLWVATHTLVLNSHMTAYYLDKNTDELTALSTYKIPAKVQGIAFDASGTVYLSTSYGRNESSYLYCYRSVTELASHPTRAYLSVEMPPASEELDVYDGSVYILFESAGEKYLEGTDGKGKSLFPLDKILMLSVDELATSGL